MHLRLELNLIGPHFGLSSKVWMLEHLLHHCSGCFSAQSLRGLTCLWEAPQLAVSDHFTILSSHFLELRKAVHLSRVLYCCLSPQNLSALYIKHLVDFTEPLISPCSGSCFSLWYSFYFNYFSSRLY